MIKKTILEDKNIFIVLFLYTFLLIFFCSLMSPLYPINDWSDINLYFNIGKAIFNGQTLYTDVFDHKGPVIFFIYGLGYLISNSSFTGMFLIEVLGWVMMVFTAYFAARLYWDKIYAFAVALVFPVIMLSHTSEGGSAEEFIVMFEVVSLYLFILYFKDRDCSIHKPAYMLIHGLMCSLTLFTKINLVAFWFFPLLAIFINILLKKEYRNFIQNTLAFAIGFLIIALPLCIYFYANNALGQAWDTYIVLNSSYAKIGGLSETLEGLIVRFYLRLRFDTFEFLLILLGALYFPIKYLNNRIGQIGLILSFFALYTVIFITPGYVYYYSIPYYVYALPGCIALCNFLRLSANKKTYILLTAIALIWGIKQRDFFGNNLSDLFKEKEKDTYANQFGHVIEKEKNPTLMNLGLDSGNSIFTKLNILPNVKYFVTPNLSYQIYPEMRDAQTKYIENKEIQFIILTSGHPNYDYFSNLPALNENYEIADKYLNKETNLTHYLYKRKN